MVSATPYDRPFFDTLAATSSKSADVIVPLVLEIVGPRSVVDIGCGRGAWLRTFLENGVASVRGIDGDYVDRESLLIPKDCYIAEDLSKSIVVDGTFDLAVSLEVGEHLPANRAKDLVAALVGAAPVVVFSAAIPGQGGTRHINEQWHCYWHELFAARDFELYDILRPQLFNNPDVAWWYKQNLFLYVAKGNRLADELSSRLSEKYQIVPIASHVLAQYMSVAGLTKALRTAVWRAIKNRLAGRWLR